MENVKEISPNLLKEGQKSIIIHWVNNTDYVGNELKLECGVLLMTDRITKYETKNIDMRYPHHCVVKIID